MINVGNNFIDFIYINDVKKEKCSKTEPRIYLQANAKGKNKKKSQAVIRGEKKELQNEMSIILATVTRIYED